MTFVLSGPDHSSGPERDKSSLGSEDTLEGRAKWPTKKGARKSLRRSPLKVGLPGGGWVRQGGAGRAGPGPPHRRATADGPPQNGLALAQCMGQQRLTTLASKFECSGAKAAKLGPEAVRCRPKWIVS